MIKITLGEMLKRFRIEKGVEAWQVCEGLCSPSMMSYYEKGKVVPDTLLFEYMMERMGVSPELFSMMVSREEYEYYEWKERVRQAIGEHDKERLRELLSSKIVTKSFCNKKLEKQFVLYAKAILCGIDEQYEKAAVMLEEAMHQTILNVEEIQKTSGLLSAMELHILMLYLYYGVLCGVINQKDGKMMFDILEKYIGGDTLDLIIRAQLYPKLCCIGFVLFEKRLSDREKIALCENAVALMKKDMSFYEITNVLRLYLPLLKKHNRTEVKFYQKQYEAFEDILRMSNIETEFYVENLIIVSPQIYLINEYLLSRRQLKEMTQEHLSEGICEPETYSRVETGKRAPSNRNLEELTQKLDINWCFYKGELDTSNLKAVELRLQQRRSHIYGENEKSIEILEALKQEIDMDNVVNVQYVKANEYIAMNRMEEMSYEETYIALKELLNLTQEGHVSEEVLVYYSQTELEIITYMALMLRRMGEYEKGIKLLLRVLKQIKMSESYMKHQWRGYEFLLRVLGGLYFASGEYNKTVEIVKYVQKENNRRYDGGNLAETLDEIADAYEHLGVRYSDEYKKLYRNTYYVTDFYGKIEHAVFMDNFYKTNFDSGIKWY